MGESQSGPVSVRHLPSLAEKCASPNANGAIYGQAII